MDQHDYERMVNIPTRAVDSFLSGYFRGVMHGSGARPRLEEPVNPKAIYTHLSSNAKPGALRIEIDKEIAHTLADHNVSKDATLKILQESPEYEHLEANQGTGDKYLTMVVNGTEKQRQVDMGKQIEQVLTRGQAVQRTVEIERDR